MKSVIVEFLAKTAELVEGAGEAKDAVTKTAKAASEGAATTEAATEKASSSIGDMMDKVQKWGAGIGIAVGVLGEGMEKLGAPFETAEAGLDQAIKNSGGSAEALKGPIDHVTNSMAKLGFNSADTDNALAKLTQSTGSGTKALGLMSTAADLARASHESLQSAADQLALAEAGSTRLLKQYGIIAVSSTTAETALTTAKKAAASASDAVTAAQKKLTDTETIDAASKKLSVSQTISLANAHDAVTAAEAKAAAAAASVTAAQKTLTTVTTGSGTAIAQLQEKLKGTAAAMSDNLGGKIDAFKTKLENLAAPIAAKVGPALTLLGPLLLGISQVAPLVTAAVGGIGTAMDFLAANPIVLIIAALVAIGVGLYELYQHCTTFRDIVKIVFNDVRIGFDDLVAGFKIDWAIGEAVFDDIKTVVEAVASAVVTAWQGVKAGFSDVWVGIEDVFKTGVNLIIGYLNGPLDAVNDVMKAISKVPVIGSVFSGISLPTLPHLAAGGVVSSPTVALIGEAGPEAVVPLHGGGATGGGSVTVIVQGSVVTEQQLIQTMRAGIQRLGRYNATALNGYA